MAKRQVINLPGLGHGAVPIPLAVRLGPLLCSGSIDGKIPGLGGYGEGAAEQIAQAFRNLRQVVEAAGGDTGCICKLDVRLARNDLREALNHQWLSMFPHDDDRPARHVTIAELPGACLIQVEATAYIDQPSG